MSQKTTAQQKAEERYPYRSDQWEHLEMMEQNRDAFIACYTEQVEPRDRMMQELALALERCVNENGEIWGDELQLITKAKEQFGITPTQP